MKFFTADLVSNSVMFHVVSVSQAGLGIGPRLLVVKVELEQDLHSAALRLIT